MINKIVNISPAEMDEYIDKNKKVIIVDVRKERKYLQKHIKGAINIMYEDIVEGKYNLSKEKEIILYCERGGMSLLAAKYLAGRGYKVKNVVGGLKNYRGKNIVQ